MIAVASMNANTLGRGIWTILRALVVDRPFTSARRARLRAAREADRAWATMVVQGDDPRALDRLAEIMSDTPRICGECGGQADVCRAIGCDPEGAPTNSVRSALVVSRS